MRYCKECLQPDTRPQIEFDETGICPACHYAHTLAFVNWDKRKQELLSFCEKYRSKSGEYDCVVGVSGGKDSTRQALYVRDVLGMNPLLISLTYSPEQQTERGAHNIANLANLGFDITTIGPSPDTWKKLVKRGFFEYGNWARSTELALFSSVPRFAVAYQINVIFWGENPMLTLGEVSNLGRKSGGIVESTLGGHTLGGGDISWMLDEHTKANHLMQYRYPSPSEINKAELRFVYLGYYWQSWSKIFNACFSGSRGLDIRTEHPSITGDDLGVDALDDDWVALNQMMKYYKFGFGKVTDNVNERIRQGDLSRQQAISIVERFDGQCGEQVVESFCKYVNISESEFWKVVAGYVNPKLFSAVQAKSGMEVKKWLPRFQVGVDYDSN